MLARRVAWAPAKRAMGKIALVAALLFSQQAFAACEEDTIDDVSEDGSTITLLSGDVYEVDPVDQVDSQLWLSTDDILVCDQSTMINKDENAERVHVRRLTP
jgi:hypothetical protein